MSALLTDAEWLDEYGEHIDDSDICDCGERHGGIFGGVFCPASPVVKTATGHECVGCDDTWSETRTADSVDTVRRPGWLA